MDAPKLKRRSANHFVCSWPSLFLLLFFRPPISPHSPHPGDPRLSRQQDPGRRASRIYAFAGAGRTPIRILPHMGNLFGRALHLADGRHAWRNAIRLLWDEEVGRFLAALTLSICVTDTAIAQGLATA